MREMTDQEKRVLAWARMDAEEFAEMLRWFGRQELPIQIEVFDEQRKIYQKEKKEFSAQYKTDQIASRLALLARASKAIYKKMNYDLRKNYDRNLDSLAETTRLRIQKIKKLRERKKGDKYKKIKKRIVLIDQLLQEGLTWREIALYLAKYSKFKVNAAYLWKVYRKIKAEEKENVGA